MDFKTPNLKWKLESRQCDGNDSNHTAKQVFSVSAATTSAKEKLFTDMSNAGGKPVALSHMEGFSDLYIPVNCLPDFPNNDHLLIKCDILKFTGDT